MCHSINHGHTDGLQLPFVDVASGHASEWTAVRSGHRHSSFPSMRRLGSRRGLIGFVQGSSTVRGFKKQYSRDEDDEDDGSHREKAPDSHA
jgi:hypothetical protein